MMPQTPSRQTPWYLTQFSQSPSAVLLHFTERHRQSEISSISKVILVVGKARSLRAPNMGSRGAESPEWFDVQPKNSAGDMIHEQAPLSWWSCQSPVAHSVGLLNHLNSFCGGIFKVNTNLMWIRCSTCSVTWNAMATQYTCSLSGICCPHWLVQWSHPCSHMHIPVHSPWLPGYIDVVQTVLVILTIAVLFPGRPCIAYS